MKKILGHIRRCVEDFDMISDGEKVVVGVSGGKDSMVLLLSLHNLSRFYPKKFQVEGITLDMGFPDTDFSPIAEFCKREGIKYTVQKTDIAEIIFEHRKEKNPCSLCSKMRRGALHDFAKSVGSSTVALGHHFDDVVETFFLSLFYEGRINCFSPATFLDRKEVNVIRPMLYVREGEIKAFTKRMNIPVVKSSCPADGNTKRQFIKDTLAKLEIETPGLKERLFGAVARSDIQGWKIVK